MKPVLSVAEIRAAEDAFFAANPGVDLMGRAAEHATAAALDMIGRGTQVLVAVGPGNNGGDALFAAAAIANSGRRVRLWLVAGRAHPAGLAAATAAGCLPLSARNALERLPIVDLVIDGVTGIGGRAGLPPDVATFAAACRMHCVPVLSLDVPSGLDADSHQVSDSFRADRTVTFAARKMCHAARPAAESCGEVTVADIGIDLPDADVWVVEPADVARWWPRPDVCADKYSRGVLGLDTGSTQYPGAAVLGVMGASHSGVGMVRYFGPAREAVLRAVPSAVGASGRVQATVLGSGWGARDDARVAAAASHGVPLVLDAEALQSLPAALPAFSVLTPHAGELARLLGCSAEEVQADPISSVRSCARDNAATVLLKGATGYVATPSGQVLIAVPGPAWTAQAGSGDVLAGCCGALLASGAPPERAAVMAASIQAMTAQANPGPYPPDALAARMPALIGAMTAS